MKEILLSQGKVAVVDDEDYEWLSQWKWSATKNKKRKTWYAVRGEGKRPFRRLILMHRQIMSAQGSVQVDHRDLDGLHNWRRNLRVCTNSENNRNKGLQKNSTTGYKGVSWHKQSGKYQSKIQANGKHYRLGLYNNPVDAALAYDRAAAKMHGEYAKLNFE